MTALKPARELLAAARRIACREWTLGPNDSYNPYADPILAQFAEHRLIWLHFVTPGSLVDGTDSDRWALTTKGRAWLAEHDPEMKENR